MCGLLEAVEHWPRTGLGFDAHRFAQAGAHRPLWLACLRWKEDEARGWEGLDGDSDGDVAAHALIDAVLSAADLGDIGLMFGVGDQARGKGMHGDVMLQETAAAVSAAGFRIINANISIIGNAPRISKLRDEAEQAMSQAVGASVTITATTTDGMGFTGRGEGIAAIATAMLSQV